MGNYISLDLLISKFGKDETERITSGIPIYNNNTNAASWEANHQRRILEHYGLSDEFPFGCDSIEAVAEALIDIKEINAVLEGLLKSYSTLEDLKLGINKRGEWLGFITTSTNGQTLLTIFAPNLIVYESIKAESISNAVRIFLNARNGVYQHDDLQNLAYLTLNEDTSTEVSRKNMSFICWLGE